MATTESQQLPDIPKTHKAAIYDEPGTISTKIVDIETPVPGPGELLIKLSASGVCASDLGIMDNSWKTLPMPSAAGQIGGHEGVGRIVAFGAGADLSGHKLGDRVGVKWVAGTCNNCGPCHAGIDAACHNVKVSGYYTPGTFQQYVLSPSNYVTPIPDAVSDVDAAPFLCAGVTVYSALRKSLCRPGDWVVIAGAGGGLGHLACQIAAKGFGYRVLGIDHPSKEGFVKGSGAEAFVALDGASSEDITKKVHELTDGLGAQSVIVATSANAAYSNAVQMLRFGGRVVCVGLPSGDPLPIAGAAPGQLIAQELSIVGSAVGTRGDAIAVLDMAARGIVKVHSRTDKLENLTTIFKDMKAGKLEGRVVLDLNA